MVAQPAVIAFIFKNERRQMPSIRIIFQDWIVRLGRDPKKSLMEVLENKEIKPNPKIYEMVQSALNKLTNLERFVITEYHFNGKPCSKIATELDKSRFQIEKTYRRGMNKLRNFLTPFVIEEFGLEMNFNSKCPLCRSSRRLEINQLILAKKEEDTWKKTIAELKEKYHIKITTPQILIGHQKYHMLSEEKNEQAITE
ncbi:MAG: sigma factor-like helix-turn-helix DNA-binding protein [Candidatus Zixiibacteriota bacterium]